MAKHEYYMQQALNLARLTAIQTRPNPQVGALIVKDDQVVGLGTHLFAGDAHAEILALQQAGERSSGATLYITLEPCAHHGKTPPCANAVVKAGISRVFIANLDPNPLVAGKGVAILQAAGIEVIIGLCSAEATELNQVFFHNIQTQTPFVTIKAGLSLDGRIATKDNLSQWITSVESRQDAHQYRVNHEAILVGINTLLTDDPSLTPHLLESPTRKPIRIILDRQLRTPLTAKVVIDQQAPTWICTSNADSQLHAIYQAHGVKIIYLSELSIAELLKRLYQEQVYSLLVEGGEQIYSSFLDARAVNQLVCYYSPQLIGSKAAKHLFAGIGFNDLRTNLQFKISEVQQLGNDVKIVNQIIKGQI